MLVKPNGVENICSLTTFKQCVEIDRFCLTLVNANKSTYLTRPSDSQVKDECQETQLTHRL
jgi:hypothetical protein